MGLKMLGKTVINQSLKKKPFYSLNFTRKNKKKQKFLKSQVENSPS